ncbi:MAG TPA: carboxypeptidase-like regulatory domain-containing protein [Candidatus Thermoplasmatota archaeon]|nr:carboxypeptidase-like regulatory domain-containing protein [Candidatus Thermoplasmatota archaeon]
MRPRPLLLVLLLFAAALAGCAGGGAPKEAVADPGFEDIDLQVTATTGAIRGIVVDERIVPIKGATVKATGAGLEKSAETDEEGRFVFAGLEPGTYFLAATSPLHKASQTSAEVVAGVEEPPLTRILLDRLFAQEPFVDQQKFDGFIQCNQAGVYYSSAPCITDFSSSAGPTLNGTGPCTPSGCAPQLRRVLSEHRGFRTAVGPGWQSIVLEMVWTESSETFDEMGITFSYNETQRPASHWYARSESLSPLLMEIKLGVPGPNEQIPDGTPELIPPEGHSDLYYFVGVRTSDAHPAALAVNQPFQVFQTTFYFAVPPEGWSFVNEDPLPF